MISKTFESIAYLVDTHTAVAMAVNEDSKKETGDKTPTVSVFHGVSL
jgi:threonine synthase